MPPAAVRRRRRPTARQHIDDVSRVNQVQHGGVGQSAAARSARWGRSSARQSGAEDTSVGQDLAAALGPARVAPTIAGGPVTAPSGTVAAERVTARTSSASGDARSQVVGGDDDIAAGVRRIRSQGGYTGEEDGSARRDATRADRPDEVRAQRGRDTVEWGRVERFAHAATLKGSGGR